MELNMKSFDLVKKFIVLVNEASKYIRGFKLDQNKDLKIDYKGINDPFTKADLTSQFIIQKGINYWFKNLEIVGEEDQNIDSLDFDFNELINKLEQYKISNFNEIENLLTNELYEFNNSILFIDPIDGTKEYINNNFNNVTTLIGLTENNSPSLGLISKPFGKFFDKNDKNKNIMPLVYFSFKNQNKIIKLELKENENIIFLENIEVIESHKSKTKDIKIIRSGSNNFSEEDKNLIKELNPNEVWKLRATGIKFVNLIENKAEMLTYFGQKTSKWDICAGEALIKQIDGELINKNLKNYFYKIEDNYYNKEGLFIGMSKESLNIIKNIIKK